MDRDTQLQAARTKGDAAHNQGAGTADSQYPGLDDSATDPEPVLGAPYDGRGQAPLPQVKGSRNGKAQTLDPKFGGGADKTGPSGAAALGKKGTRRSQIETDVVQGGGLANSNSANATK